MTHQDWDHDRQPPAQPPPGYSGEPPWSNSYPPPQPGAWGPPGPRWASGPPPPPKRNTALIAALTGVAVLIVVGVAAVVIMSTSTPNRATPHPSVTATPSTTGPTTRIVPAQVLPTDRQVAQATLLNLSKHGDVDTTVYPDSATTPPQCGLLDAAGGASVTSTAISVATQTYADRPGDEYNDSANAIVAAYNGPSDVDAALAKIRSALRDCTSYTGEIDTSKPNDPPSHWTVSDVATGEQLAWKDTLQTDHPWACSWVARGHRDLLIVTMVCDHNPGHGASSLAEVVTTNIDSQH